MSRRLLARTAPLLLCGALLVPAGETPARADEDAALAKATRAYEAYLRRPSLYMRTRGRTRYAATGHVEALRRLLKDYGRPEAPKDRVPHLIASACWRGCNEARHAPIYAEGRAAHRKPNDAWLWFHALRVESRADRDAEIYTLAQKAPSAWLRASALLALAAESRRGLLAEIPRLVEEMPSGALDRALLPQALAACLLGRRDARKSEAFRPAAEAVIGLLDDRRVPLRAKLVVARHLADFFGTDVLGVNAAPWRKELDASDGGARRPAEPDDRYAADFVGIRASGRRIVYAIDASDSMLAPLTAQEREAPRGPVTGERDGEGKDRLPWDSIETRFDLARELLIQSIEGLARDRSFAVVLFGTEAKLLASTPGLVDPSPKRVLKVIKELRAIHALPGTQKRPAGVLRGDTNLHAAFDRAFRVRRKGMEKKDAYVNEKLLETGCDTVFLFSDGAPSMDDYLQIDRRDPEDNAGDPETGTSYRNTPELSYYGPYVDNRHYLVSDVRRMNLFRAAEIHCVGIGEAEMGLLQRLADAGLGTTKQLGR